MRTRWSLSPQHEEWLGSHIGPSSERVAKAVLALSDFYVKNHGEKTPWGRIENSEMAYLSYFHPLNVLRLKAVLKETARFLRDSDFTEIWDFGSGAGAVHMALEEQKQFLPKPLYCVEADALARGLHQKWCSELKPRWSAEWRSGPTPSQGALAVFSYSYLEMSGLNPPLKKFDHVLILEPSFQDTGRDLMKARQDWLEQGWTMLAPCPHQKPCPLLTHSPRDWCHHRIHIERPTFLEKLERHLPMENRSLTYSYLLMTRSASAAAAAIKETSSTSTGLTRVIGDTLFEKGKTRQMICRGPDREFLSWLTREGAAPEIPHGALISDLGPFEKKGQELRVGRDLKWTED